MLAASATSIDPADPLSGLTVGERPEPDPPPGWEVVEVRAAALNHHDLWTLRGVGIDPDRLPIVLGCDGAGLTADGRRVLVHGVVGAPEDGDETLTSGSSILSEQHDGTLAQRVAVPSRNLVDLPAGLSFEEGACLPTAWLTAYRMLFTRAELRPGQRVLIQGAGGGVATAAIALARAAGLHVTVTSRDDDRLTRAQQLGAHAGIRRDDDRLTRAQQLVAHAGIRRGERVAHRVDAVLETVGEATWSHSLKALVAGGTVVVAGATTGSNPPADLARIFARQLRVVGSTMGSRTELQRLVQMLETTGLRPLIDDVAPLTDARAAFVRLLDGRVFGKLVLTP